MGKRREVILISYRLWRRQIKKGGYFVELSIHQVKTGIERAYSMFLKIGFYLKRSRQRTYNIGGCAHFMLMFAIFLIMVISLHWLIVAFMGMQVNMNIKMTTDMNV
ncbi:hypothetical protein NC796_18550 [Aliifodinibius sp. S!AR15-10]|uniref:hypothetical protein n=1 Tax=Aliifodinibius sp. S!AR15-10 TaxID=2950437 RepID=UPI0028578C58|nr:hypothetical protein [Aliifodinibius sp. S!AR15-10]MDR8393162.1 hypothetical protein [Aliifodinibius sp. S!AR15-10]